MKIEIKHKDRDGGIIDSEVCKTVSKNDNSYVFDMSITFADLFDGYQILATIIHPFLVAHKNANGGSPFVHDEDVPENLRYSGTEEDRWKDDGIHERWSWVLDEMIWAFEQCANDYDDQQFYHNLDQLEINFVKRDDTPEGFNEIEFDDQKDPSRPKYWVDKEGLKAHNDRKANGLRLFGKYFTGIWI